MANWHGKFNHITCIIQIDPRISNYRVEFKNYKTWFLLSDGKWFEYFQHGIKQQPTNQSIFTNHLHFLCNEGRYTFKYVNNAHLNKI